MMFIYIKLTAQRPHIKQTLTRIKLLQLFHGAKALSLQIPFALRRVTSKSYLFKDLFLNTHPKYSLKICKKKKYKQDVKPIIGFLKWLRFGVQRGGSID